MSIRTKSAAPDLASIIAAHPGIGRSRLAALAGIGQRAARTALERARIGAPVSKSASSATAAPAAAPAGVLTLSDIRRKYDVTEKIRIAIKDHLTGRDAFIDDARFRELATVHINHWRRHAQLPEFADYQVRLSGVTYWASPQNIKRVRELTGVS